MAFTTSFCPILPRLSTLATFTHISSSSSLFKVRSRLSTASLDAVLPRAFAAASLTSLSSSARARTISCTYLSSPIPPIASTAAFLTAGLSSFIASLSLSMPSSPPILPSRIITFSLVDGSVVEIKGSTADMTVSFRLSSTKQRASTAASLTSSNSSSRRFTISGIALSGLTFAMAIAALLLTCP